VIVSWYFSTRYSHPTQHGRLEGPRERLSALQLEEGLVQCIEDLDRMGLFRALRSWAGASRADGRLMVVRYEDLIGAGSAAEFTKIFLHCDIPIGGVALQQLLERYSFNRMSGGRARGDEDKLSKYRKGQAGDWVNYFTPAVQSRYDAVTGDLTAILGYPASAQPEGS
jgi:hypothetical protein